MACGVAGLVEGLLVEAYLAATKDGLPLFVEADAVAGEQPVLAAVQAPVGVAQRPLIGFEHRRCFVDIALADVFIDRLAPVYQTAKCGGAYGQVVLEETGVELTVEGGLRFFVAAGVIGAAVVRNVVVTFGAEVVGHSGVGATGGTVAAPGKGAVIVDHHAAARSAEAGLPGIVQAVFEQAVKV